MGLCSYGREPTANKQMTITKTADLFSQAILVELAEASDQEVSYEEMRAQVRATRPLMNKILDADPGAPFAQIRQAFIREYTGLDFLF